MHREQFSLSYFSFYHESDSVNKSYKWKRLLSNFLILNTIEHITLPTLLTERAKSPIRRDREFFLSSDVWMSVSSGL